VTNSDDTLKTVQCVITNCGFLAAFTSVVVLSKVK